MANLDIPRVCRRCRAFHTSTRWNYEVVANQQVQGWLYWGTTDCIQTSLWPVQLPLEVYAHPVAISRGTLELPGVKQLSRMYWTRFFTHNGNQSQVKLAPNAIFIVANNQCTAEPITVSRKCWIRGNKLLYDHVPDPFPWCGIGSGHTRLGWYWVLYTSYAPKDLTEFGWSRES